jgi:hypothetical protein
MTKSPNKFNSCTCRENLTTAYGNHVISTGGKIQIKHGGKYSRGKLFAVPIANLWISRQFLFANIFAYTVVFHVPTLPSQGGAHTSTAPPAKEPKPQGYLGSRR